MKVSASENSKFKIYDIFLTENYRALSTHKKFLCNFLISFVPAW